MNDLHTPVCDLLGCRYPIVLAGMGGVSRSELVAAVSAAGGFGFLGMVRESPTLIAAEVEAVRRDGHQRFGVNLIPAATPADLLEAELAAIIALAVPVVALFWDIDRAIVQRLRDAGITVVYQVGSVEEGEAAVAAGAQILIAQGIEAGGHVRGTRPLFELLSELVRAVDVPVLAAGGIVDGAEIAAALALGAQGAVLGTAMIATREAFAHDLHKERLLAAGNDDTVLTDAFHINWPKGARVRVLDGPVTQGRHGDPWAEARRTIGWDDGRPIYLFSTDSPLRSTAGELGDMPLYAGMGVGRLTKMTTAARRIARLAEDAEALLQAPPAVATPALASPVCFAGVSPDYMGYLDHDALLAALAALRRDGAAALQAARRGSARQRHYVRWLMALRQLVTELAGSDAGLGESAAAADGASGTRLVASARALMPKIFEERVRQGLEALLSAHAALPPEPAADAAPMPPETPRASAR